MTEFNLVWSEKAIKEYVKHQIFGSKALMTAILVMYIVAFIGVPVISFVAYFTMQFPALLIIAIACIAIGLTLGLTLIITMNRTAKKTHEALSENKDLICAVSDKDVLLIKNNLPYGVIEWKSFTEIFETDSAFFLTTKENLLLILEKDSIHSGVLSEAQEVLKIKSEALANAE